MKDIAAALEAREPTGALRVRLAEAESDEPLGRMKDDALLLADARRGPMRICEND